MQDTAKCATEKHTYTKAIIRKLHTKGTQSKSKTFEIKGKH